MFIELPKLTEELCPLAAEEAKLLTGEEATLLLLVSTGVLANIALLRLLLGRPPEVEDCFLKDAPGSEKRIISQIDSMQLIIHNQVGRFHERRFDLFVTVL